jgi:hypothetical protein
MYDRNYCTHYIKQSIKSDYFEYKNEVVANAFNKLGVKKIVDLGSNVNSVIKEVSLRSKLEEFNIDYFGLDLDPSYFSFEFINSLINENSLNLYDNPKGIVGDIEKMPFPNDSVEAFAILDVLEHVEKQKKAISEIKRALIKTKGFAIFVLPSLYKLDLFDFEYIGNKRKSNHISKITIPEWQDMISNSGLVINNNLSKPIGVLSGLSYLLWLNEKFLPIREINHGPKVHTEFTIFHKQIKNLFAKYDRITDPLFSVEFQHKNLIDFFINEPDSIKSITEPLQIKELNSTVDSFIEAFSSITIDEYRLNKVKNVTKNLPKFAMANSCMLIFKNEQSISTTFNFE